MAGHEVSIVEIIGMTEVVAAHRFWLNQNEEIMRRTAPSINFVGHPHPILAACITRSDGSVIEPGNPEPGEVRYRSPALMAGYYRDEEATREAFEGGWFHTGDLFQYAEGTQRAMVDRLKDVVKSGGENVSSIRVEAILEGHPGVARAAVVGVPHEKWGEAVTAAVIPTDPASAPSERELINYCKERLAPFEVPKRVVMVDKLPQAVGGKLQKHLIRDQLKNVYQEAGNS
jgi:acyl-CoA synthetase (AMP-forming)/AMP-acid ligase II